MKTNKRFSIGDWEEKKPGYYPFAQGSDADTIDEDPEGIEKRKIRRDPYKNPDQNTEKEPTGVIVRSQTDKIAVGPPCLIWIPLELMELVQAHSVLASKFLPRTVDLYHPSTNLFLNSNGKPIASIQCKHFKNYIGLPITGMLYFQNYCLMINILFQLTTSGDP